MSSTLTLIILLIVWNNFASGKLLSLNKSIRSSSTFTTSTNIDLAPQKAVDGNHSTDTKCCCAKTQPESKPWFELDLGRKYLIERIAIEIDSGFFGYSGDKMEFFLVPAQDIQGVKPFRTVTLIAESTLLNFTSEPTESRFLTTVLQTRLFRTSFVVCELSVYGDCVDGEYGEDCDKQCHCQGQPCNKETGVCPSTKCLPGFRGAHCENECEDGKYGHYCSQVCGKCFNMEPCNKTDGTCTRCAAGYSGPECTSPCERGYFGVDCVDVCGNCSGGDVCDVTSGKCPNGCSEGYEGLLCKQACERGYFGVDCVDVCGNCSGGDVCDVTSGKCPNGCSEGYEGLLCKQACERGYFGVDCVDVCGNCSGGDVCDVTSGKCPNGCSEGYEGLLCKQACERGYFGVDCVNVCGNCSGGDVCDVTSGKCPNGCSEGYEGLLCKQENSERNVTCPDNMELIGITIGGTIAGILLVEGVTGAVIYLIWKSGRCKRKKQRLGRTAIVQQEALRPDISGPYELADRSAFEMEHPYGDGLPDYEEPETHYEN